VLVNRFAATSPVNVVEKRVCGVSRKLDFSSPGGNF
jgi:hypothetical protein